MLTSPELALHAPNQGAIIVVPLGSPTATGYDSLNRSYVEYTASATLAGFGTWTLRARSTSISELVTPSVIEVVVQPDRF